MMPVRIVLKPDYEDPAIKMMLTRAAISASGQIFGELPGPGGVLEGPGHVPPAQITHTDGPIEPAALPNGSEPAEDADYEEATAAAGPPDPDEVARNDFQMAAPGEKIKMIDRLMVQKGYDKKQLKKPLGQFSEAHLIGFYDALAAMPDDDIPF